MDVSLREYIERIFDERERTHAAQRDGVARALAEAELTLNRRLSEMNEFRKQILEERSNYARKDQLDAHASISDTRLRKLEDASSNREGKFWALGVGLAIFTTLINIAFRLLGH